MDVITPKKLIWAGVIFEKNSDVFGNVWERHFIQFFANKTNNDAIVNLEIGSQVKYKLVVSELNNNDKSLLIE